MIPYFRSLGFTQMLTNGAEGYRANTTHDSSAPTTYPFNNWLNDARKGVPPSPAHSTALTSGSLVAYALLVAAIWHASLFKFWTASADASVGPAAGEDFVRNLGIPGIDFYGIHVVSPLPCRPCLDSCSA